MAWMQWRESAAYTVGVEEELMLLDPADWSLAPRSDEVLDALAPAVAVRATVETHKSALELATGVHGSVPEAAAELARLRRDLKHALDGLGLCAAGAGLHPFTLWSQTAISPDERYQRVLGSMRDLARREPTFALHVHVGVAEPEDALRLANRLRAHLPLLLALSTNSPFWQGRDTGLASARTPVFQAFPRVGIPRLFASYADYVEAVDVLVRCGAIPEPTFLWWDVRLQPALGTVEVRIPDAQTRVVDGAALTALIQSVARLELEEGYAHPRLLEAPEVLEENRFLAARDGIRAELVVPQLERRVPARELLAELLEACAPHAHALGCEAELASLGGLAARPGDDRQREHAREGDRLEGLVAWLAGEFLAGGHQDGRSAA